MGITLLPLWDRLWKEFTRGKGKCELLHSVWCCGSENKGPAKWVGVNSAQEQGDDVLSPCSANTSVISVLHLLCFHNSELVKNNGEDRGKTCIWFFCSQNHIFFLRDLGMSILAQHRDVGRWVYNLGRTYLFQYHTAELVLLLAVLLVDKPGGRTLWKCCSALGIYANISA